MKRERTVRRRETVSVGDMTVEFEFEKVTTISEWKSETFVPALETVFVSEVSIPGIGGCRAEIQVGENR